MERQTPTIIQQANIPATLRAIEPGASVVFRARAFAPLPSVRAAISRLNAQAGFSEFAVSTDDNGTTYTITRMHYDTF